MFWRFFTKLTLVINFTFLCKGLNFWLCKILFNQQFFFFLGLWSLISNVSCSLRSMVYGSGHAQLISSCKNFIITFISIKHFVWYISRRTVSLIFLARSVWTLIKVIGICRKLLRRSATKPLLDIYFWAFPCRSINIKKWFFLWFTILKSVFRNNMN